MIYLLQQTVLAGAERTPDKAAFVCGRDRLTYGEAAIRIQQLARALTDLGVRRGDRVGVYLNRSIETAIALHGIMLAGAAYVPLDPKATAERLAFQLEDCGIRTVVSNAATQKNWARTRVRSKGLKSVVGFPQPPDGLEGPSWPDVCALPTDFAPAFSAVETDLAYVMYTSGSTGRPKGIMHTHASGLAFARLAAATHGLTAADVFGNHAPIYFDVSTLAYFAAPLLGATAVIVTDGHTVFPASLSKLLANEGITVWYSAPLALTRMLQSGTLDQVDLSALRQVFYAGEPFAPKYIRQWRAAVPHARLTNWYGPAETNVCTYFNIEADPVGEGNVAIGKVWGNTEFLVAPFASRLPSEVPQPLSRGEGRRGSERSRAVANQESRFANQESPIAEGELLIRSTTLMAGYWNRPDRTAAAFYDHPNPSGLPHRYYRTGDLVRLHADGNLHFLGRADNQVKVRGYRVELDAVEARLLAHPYVAEAAVLALPTDEGTLNLHGFVIVGPQAEPDAKTLATFAGQTLPWYAVPETFHFRAGFPRTGSGKIDRPALRRAFPGGQTS